MAYATIPQEKLKRVKRIALGGFGTVYKALWDSREVAAKQLGREEGQREVHFLSKLDHPNIVKLLGVVDDDVDFYIVLELCHGGTLQSYLKAHRGTHLGQRFYDWAKQAGKPIAYLKTMGVVHKDIKSPNYLITNGSILKLCDFGLAKKMDSTITRATETASYPWMAPELLRDNLLSPTYDIHAYGVVVWELWTTDIPFEGCDVPANLIWRICNNNERPPIPLDCPKPIADLLRQCWQVDWKKRPNMEQVMSMLTSAEVYNAQQQQEQQQQQFIAGPWKLENELCHQDGAEKLHGVSDIAICPNGEMAVVSFNTSRLEQSQFITGHWELENEFGHQHGPGKVNGAFDIAVCPNGDMAIASCLTDRVCMYSNEGLYKSHLDLNQGMNPGVTPRPWNVTVNADGIIYATCRCYVLMYTAPGVYKDRWVAMSPSPDSISSDSADTRLRGLTIDSNGQLLVGQIRNPRYISKHNQDGSHIASIKVNKQPWYIAATSNDTIVICDRWNSTVQIVDNTGQVLYTLNTNRQVSVWNGVCCYNDIILVCNSDMNNTHEISCFSVSAVYLGSIAVSNRPWSVTIAKDNCKLLVGCKDRVLVYANKPITQ